MKKIILKPILTILIIFFSLTQSSFAAFHKEEITLQHDTQGVYIFKINTKKTGAKIKPYVAEKLTTATDIFTNNKNFALVVNGGFFDILTGGAVSYVIRDGKTIETPFSNPSLIDNAQKSGRLEAILNRAEFRVLEDEKGALSFDIAPHFAPVEDGKTIRHSLQGGPEIYPKMNLEKESFVIKEKNKVKFQAADVLKRRERTVLALKKDTLYIIIFTNQNKVTMAEARDFCAKMGVNKAMALDGGASTSVNYKNIEIFSSLTSQRRVKSFLVIEK